MHRRHEPVDGKRGRKIYSPVRARWGAAQALPPLAAFAFEGQIQGSAEPLVQLPYRILRQVRVMGVGAARLPLLLRRAEKVDCLPCNLSGVSSSIFGKSNNNVGERLTRPVRGTYVIEAVRQREPTPIERLVHSLNHIGREADERALQ